MAKSLITVILTCYFIFSHLFIEGGLAQERPIVNEKFQLTQHRYTLKTLIETIEKQTGMHFFYNASIDLDQKITISKGFTSLPELLEEIMSTTALRFKQINNTISVRNASENEIPFISLEGTVTDTEGNTLPGAAVVIKDTSIGTVTDYQGRFNIKAPQNSSSIIISFIGYVPQEVNISTQNYFEITLEQDITSLNEVLVVGYGSQKKAEVSGTIVALNHKSYEKQPITNIDYALQGRAAGLELTQSSGDPATGMRMRIRGSNSINFNNAPLYILDGVIIGDISPINVNDIESINILKDASATSIYGSRGANGVILISTKKGTPNALNIQFDSYFSHETPAKHIATLTPAEFAQQANIKNMANNGNPIFSETEIERLSNGGGTDWQHEALNEHTTSHNHNLSISGGSEKTTFFISANNSKINAIVKNRIYDRYSFRANLEHNLNHKIEIGSNISLNKENIQGSIVQLDNALTYDPTTSYFNSNGNIILTSPRSVGNINRNEVIIADLRKYVADQRKIFANAYIKFHLNNSLSWQTKVGSELYNGVNKTFSPAILGESTNIKWFDGQNTRYNITNQLTYSNVFNQHSLKIDAVEEYQALDIQQLNITGADLVSEALEENALSSARSVTTTPAGWKEKISSYMLRADYSYKSKYNATITGRYDGSSNFNASHRWGFFPSMGASWLISSEPFMSFMDETIDLMKLRISYGITGNQNVGNPNKLTIGFYDMFPGWDDEKADWPASNFSYPVSNGEPQLGFVPTSTASAKNLTWETNKQFNTGLDLEMLQGRLVASVDLYYKKADNLILKRKLPSYVGVNTLIDNIGAIENKGFEISLDWKSEPSQQIFWQVDGNISLNKNKVLDLGYTFDKDGNRVPLTRDISLGSQFYEGTGGGIVSILKVGSPLGLFYGYDFQGIYQLSQEDDASRYGLKPGDPIYRDINEDGVIDANDKTIIGSANPDFIWGLNGQLVFHNFDLSVSVYGKVGGQVFNLSKGVRMGWFLETAQPTDRDILNRWTPSHPSNEIPGFTGSSDANKLTSSQYVEDATFTRIQNVTLGYSLPIAIVNKLRLQSLRIYIGGKNLHTFTAFSGYDPEITSELSNDIDPGIQGMGLIPLSKSFIIGISAKF